MVTKRIGMIGCSPDNGHPFSFSAIINGYDPYYLQHSRWPNIYEYVRQRDASEFGFPGFRVTHVWMPEPYTSIRLCQACHVPYRVYRPEEMIGEVDAVMIARDDAASHFALAIPFLRAGIPVFVDKPLSQLPRELELFKPYLQNGLLMSCSGMRFARELDAVRAGLKEIGRIKLIRGTIVNDWEKYGVHMLEAICSLLPFTPRNITALDADFMSVVITTENGPLVQVEALDNIPPLFRLDIFSTKKHVSIDIKDNFTMFRRMIWHFLHMVKTGKPSIPPESTWLIMKLLYAGRQSKILNKGLNIKDVDL